MGIWGIEDMALNCGHLGYIRYGPELWSLGVYQRVAGGSRGRALLFRALQVQGFRV